MLGGGPIGAPSLVGQAEGETECVISAEQRQHWAMEEASNYNSRGLPGGSDVYTGPTDLILAVS